ncbi:MAG: hypothetical protein PSX81_02815 [bacterium]|nr:hypothetical protein [bacterium]
MTNQKHQIWVKTFVEKQKQLPPAFDVEKFPFENEGYRNLINQFLSFSQTNLKRSCGTVGKKAFVYIVDRNDVNGLAGRVEGIPVVGIFKGSLISLFNLIVKDTANFKKEDYLTYQITILFLYYHEKAHLIQRNTGELWQLDELTSNNGYDQQQHLREFDADLYAVTMILPHIEELAARERFPIHELIALAIAGLYILCMDFMHGNDLFYLKDKSHPHGQLRVLYILTKFIMNITVSEIIDLQEHNIGILWQDKLYKLLDRNESEFNKVISVFQNHQADMENYIMELQTLQSNFDNSATLKDPKLSEKSRNRSRWAATAIDFINEKFCSSYK